MIRKGRGEHAIPLLDHLIESDPNCSLALRERGFAKSFRGDHAGAIADFTALILQQPADPDGYARRAGTMCAGRRPARGDRRLLGSNLPKSDALLRVPSTRPDEGGNRRLDRRYIGFYRRHGALEDGTSVGAAQSGTSQAPHR